MKSAGNNLTDAEYKTFLDIIEEIDKSRSNQQRISTDFLLDLEDKAGKFAVLDFLGRYNDYHNNNHHTSEEDALQSGRPQPNFQLTECEKSILHAILGDYQPAHDRMTRRQWGTWVGILGFGAITTNIASREMASTHSKKDVTLTLDCLSNAFSGLGLIALVKVLNAPDESQKEEARNAVNEFLSDMSYTLMQSNPQLEGNGIGLQFFRN